MTPIRGLPMIGGPLDGSVAPPNLAGGYRPVLMVPRPCSALLTSTHAGPLADAVAGCTRYSMIAAKRDGLRGFAYVHESIADSPEAAMLVFRAALRAGAVAD